jgi:hypothetical protein
MKTQTIKNQPLYYLSPEKPIFDVDEVAEFIKEFRDPVQYPQLAKVDHRWDKGITLACTYGAVSCQDPEKKIFLVRTESGGEYFYRVDLSVKLPAVACTCPDDRRHPEFPCKHRIAAVLYRHFIEKEIQLEPGDLCYATYRRFRLTATVLDVYADWVLVDIDERRGNDDHRVTFYEDDHGNPVYIKWLRYGENCFLA